MLCYCSTVVLFPSGHTEYRIACRVVSRSGWLTAAILCAGPADERCPRPLTLYRGQWVRRRSPPGSPSRRKWTTRPQPCHETPRGTARRRTSRCQSRRRWSSRRGAGSAGSSRSASGQGVQHLREQDWRARVSQPAAYAPLLSVDGRSAGPARFSQRPVSTNEAWKGRPPPTGVLAIMCAATWFVSPSPG
jgi:hypothetical protein